MSIYHCFFLYELDHSEVILMYILFLDELDHSEVILMYILFLADKKKMVDAGVVEEIREYFVPGADYSRGIRRAIGVPELGEYFLVEKEMDDEVQKEKMLQHAIMKTKENTRRLSEMQLWKIQKMNYERKMTRIDSTKVFEAVLKGEDYKHLYQEIVFKPSMEIVQKFLGKTTEVKKIMPQKAEPATICA